MTTPEQTTEREYRFISQDGTRSTEWRRLPPGGGIGRGLAQARKELGQKFDLEIRERAHG